MRRPKFMSEETVAALRLVRMALSGAIAGAALFGILSPALGLPEMGIQGAIVDVAGAGAGAVAVVVFKLAHLI